MFHRRMGRFPRGKRGLKCAVDNAMHVAIGRFPRGKRGLKFVAPVNVLVARQVASPAGSVD